MSSCNLIKQNLNLSTSSFEDDFQNKPQPGIYEKNEISIDEVNSNRRILIVDDEPYNIMGLKIMLMQAGYNNI
jgi:hypothetical protein